MKRMRKVLVGICMLLAVCVLAENVGATTTASRMTLTVGTTDNASAGDTVTVRLVVSNNPGISTFATKLSYDSNYLEYTGAVWSTNISSNTNNVQMISTVQENNQPVLNISSIMSNNYSNNETLVTLSFRVKQAYTTMPVKLTVREVTDTSYNPVDVNTVVDSSAGASSQSQSESQNNSQNSSQNNSQNSSQNNSQNSSQNNSENNSQSSSENNSQNASQNNSEDSSQSDTKDSSQSSTTDKDKDKKGVDQTPKTGAVDVRLILGIAIVVFIVIAGVCIKVLGKKKHS